MLSGVDLSNHQGPPPSYRGQAWYQGAAFVIAQAILPPKPFTGWEVGGYTEAQLRAAQEDGKKIGIYVWLWNTLADTKADIRARLALVPDDLVLDMRPWLDVEDVNANTGPSRQQDVMDALEVMDEWAATRGLPATGVYSGDWYISDYLGGWFPEGRLYWLADYGLDPEVLPARPIHQYTSTPIDMDVMLESEIVTGAPPVDDTERQQLQAKIDSLVTTVADIADRLGDQLLAECKRASVRKTTVRSIVAQMESERAAAVGPRP